MKQFEDVDQYINSFPKELQERLKSIRQVIKEVAPNASEKISYGMPYYSLSGRLVYIGAFKNHISLFPAKASVVKVFKEELTGYETSKGTVRFPLDGPLPLPLIRKIVQYRVKENLAKQQ